MLRIVVGYRGGDPSIDDSIVDLYNRCMEASISWCFRPAERRELEVMFSSSWFRPEEYALVYYGDRLVSAAMAFAGAVNRVSLCIDPYTPMHIALEVAESMLSWARFSFESRGFRGLMRVAAWEYMGFHHRLLRRVLEGVPFIEVYSSTLMIYSGEAPEPRIPEGYRIRYWRQEDIPGIVRVYNRAFSIYDWFEEWRVEDARRYYEARSPIIYVATDETGEIVGYVDGEVFKALDGGVTGVVNTLAVDPGHQRRGLGRALLHTMVRDLIGRGVKRIYLDGIRGLEGMYGRLGFKVYTRWMSLIVPIPSIPMRSLNVIRIYG